MAAFAFAEAYFLAETFFLAEAFFVVGGVTSGVAVAGAELAATALAFPDVDRRVVCNCSAFDPAFRRVVTPTRIEEILAQSASHWKATVPPLRFSMGAVKLISPTQI